MSNTLKKITTRAKQIRKAHPSMAWKNAVKKAGAEYRAGKIGAVRKKAKTKFRQTGTSKTAADKQRTARRPGKRKSASGKVYYERRKNRSDVPFSLSGISSGKLGGELKKRLKEKLAMALLRRDLAISRTIRNKYADEAYYLKQQLKRLS